MAVMKGRAGLLPSGQSPSDATFRIATHLNQQRTKEARRRDRPKLSPEGHQALRTQLKNSGPLAPNDADTTKINIQGIVKKFIGYFDRRKSGAVESCRADLKLATAPIATSQTGVWPSGAAIRD